MYDVVPLSDVMAAATPPIMVPPVFVERKVPSHCADYAKTSDLPKDFIYRAAWGPDVSTPKPSYIRIVMSLDDPNGHLNGGQTYEYVFRLQ
jgi:hypothetical protein